MLAQWNLPPPPPLLTEVSSLQALVLYTASGNWEADTTEGVYYTKEWFPIFGVDFYYTMEWLPIFGVDLLLPPTLGTICWSLKMLSPILNRE